MVVLQRRETSLLRKEVERKLRKKHESHSFDFANNIAKKIKNDFLIKGIETEIVGGLRRKIESVADIDLIADKAYKDEVIKMASQYGEVKSWGNSIRINTSPNIDIFLSEKNNWGSTLIYRTGSTAHNYYLQEHAAKVCGSGGGWSPLRGLVKDNRLISVYDEESFFYHLGLEYVPPELRECTVDARGVPAPNYEIKTIKEPQITNFSANMVKQTVGSWGPENWGPDKWKEFHLRTLNPVENSSLERIWIENFTNSLPCGSCKENWLKNMKKMPPDFSNYFQWSVDIHNLVNQELCKPTLSLEEAKAKWVK